MIKYKTEELDKLNDQYNDKLGPCVLKLDQQLFDRSHEYVVAEEKMVKDIFECQQLCNNRKYECEAFENVVN